MTRADLEEVNIPDDLYAIFKTLFNRIISKHLKLSLENFKIKA